MNPFTKALQFLGTPSGDFVYHLVVLFVIEATLAMTWLYGRDDRVRRWKLAMLGLTLARLLPIGAAALAALQVLPSLAAIAPPLERFLEVISLGLLAWAFLPLLAGHSLAGNLLMIGNLIAATIVYAWSAPQWYLAAERGLYFNSLPQHILWGVWALMLSALGTAAAPIHRRSGWALSLAAFAILAAGYVLHLLIPNPASNTAEWARVGTLAAYPLFAALVLDQIIQAQQIQSALPRRAQPASATANLWSVVEACNSVAEADDIPSAIQRATVAIAQALNTDLAAVGVPGESPDTVQVVAIYNSGAPSEPGATFSLESQPAVKYAISNKRRVSLGPEQGNEAIALSTLLGSQAPRLMLLEPLLHAQETLGILIVGRAPNWSDDQERTAHMAADQLASALGLARRLEMFMRRTGEMNVRLRDLEARATQVQSALEAQIAQHKSELQHAMTQLEETRSLAAQRQKRIEELAALVELHMQEARAAREQATSTLDWQKQVKQLELEREQALAEAREWRAETERLLALYVQIQDELERAQERIAELEQSTQ